MINKPNIQEKIDAQKSELLKRLIIEFKIPVIDIIVDKNSNHSFRGIFYLVISENIKIDVEYSYSSKIFNWNINTVNNKIDEMWHSIYLKHKNEIDAQILTALEINDEIEIKEINSTIKNILIVNKKGEIKLFKFECNFIDNNWKINQE
jgi:hypothetical protein